MSHISIEAPSAVAAFLLEDSLRDDRARAVRRGLLWFVELDIDSADVDEALDVVHTWLREIGENSTTVWEDRAKRVVTGDGEWCSLRRRYTPPPKVAHQPRKEGTSCAR